jgi:hypothetical protein
LIGLPFFAPNEVFDGPELKAVSSEIVFQAPQESQRPDHLFGFSHARYVPILRTDGKLAVRDRMILHAPPYAPFF